MLLGSEDHRRIVEAVAAAEVLTRGEIVCVVIDEAAHYGEVPLAWAAAGALLLPLLALAGAQVTRHFDYRLGGWEAGHIAAAHAAIFATLGTYALFQIGLFVLLFVLFSILPIRRWLTPASHKRLHVRERAMEQFLARDLDKTREQTGVLIFVSLHDRRAEVLAGAGISDKLDQSAWNNVIADLVSGIKTGKPGDGFVAAIERCGRLLAQHFPAGQNNPNELPDALVEAPQL